MKAVHDSMTTNVYLRKLNSTYNNQGVESMNQYVSSYAQKGCAFGGSLSLTSRAYIASGVANIGHHKLWLPVYSRFGIELGTELTINY